MYDPALAEQKAAVVGATNDQAGASDAQALGYADEATMLRDQTEARQREVAAIDQRSQQWTSNLKEAIDSVPTMDVKRAFKNQSNLESASMGIAAFMGGFLQPVLGTNAPMDIIKRAVDQDIEEQHNDQQMAQQRIGNLKDLAKTDMDAAIWQLNQKDVARLSTLSALQKDVQAKVQGYQSDIYRNNGMKLLADIDKAKVDLYQGIYVNSRNFMETQRHNMVQESVQERELKLKQAEAERAARADAGKNPYAGREIRSPRTGEVIGYMATGTPEKAAEYNAKQAAAYSSSRNILKLKKLISDNGPLWKKSNWGSTQEAQELRGVYSDVLSDILHAKSGAQLSPGEYERLEKQLPFPSKINPSTFSNLENAVEKAINEQNATNTASLAPLEGQSKLGYDFRKDVDGLRAEYSTGESPVPDDHSLHSSLLELDAHRTPEELQTAARKILTNAENVADTDTGRASIQQAIDTLSQQPVEARSLPADDGQGHVTMLDPVERLKQILDYGSMVDQGRKLNAADPVHQAAVAQLPGLK
jgi:hypothetical protein